MLGSVTSVLAPMSFILFTSSSPLLYNEIEGYTYNNRNFEDFSRAGCVTVGLLLWIFGQNELRLIGQIAFYVGLGDVPLRFFYNEIAEYSDLRAMMMLELIDCHPEPVVYSREPEYEDDEEEESCIVK